MLKTIFFGNSPFSLPTLQKLQTHSNLCAIITGVDQWVTRRQKTLVEPVPKIYAREQEIPCLQPQKLTDPLFLDALQKFSPDLAIVISYGKLLPKMVFDLPPMGTFNLHASLLPSYRGASPIQEALLRGDKTTGITLQKINEKMDDGDIYGMRERNISPTMKYPELQSILAQDAAQTLEEFLGFIQKNQQLPRAHKQKGQISFCTENARDIFNKFRAYYVWPQISTSIRGLCVKLENVEIISLTATEGPPGQVLRADTSAFHVQTRKGIISIQQLKVLNRKSLDFSSFIHGYQIKQGDTLC